MLVSATMHRGPHEEVEATATPRSVAEAQLGLRLATTPHGYIVGLDGGFEWAAPDEEIFCFATDEVRQLDVQPLGRRLYEAMLPRETAAQDHSLNDSKRELAVALEVAPIRGAFLDVGVVDDSCRLTTVRTDRGRASTQARCADQVRPRLRRESGRSRRAG